MRRFFLLHRPLLLAAVAGALALTAPASAQETAANPAIATAPEERLAERPETMEIGEGTLAYTAKAGTLIVRNDEGQPVAELFYTAYELDDAQRESRPVTFIWDGGPGGSTMIMDVLGYGPLRYSAAGNPKARPPFVTDPNPDTLLRQSDLVFIDLIGTGYSRAVAPAQNSDFWGVEPDAEVTVRAIQRYLTLNERWQSPLFLLGNSYGTTRAAIVADRLRHAGIAVNGVILVASALNFGTFSNGMDHQFQVNLPTLAAVAWYHGKTAHQEKSLPDFLAEVQAFARREYGEALFMGNALPAERRKAIAQRLSGYIGLDPLYIDRAHLRVSAVRFRKELLRREGLVVGRLDGREISVDFDHAGEEPEDDHGLLPTYYVPATAILRDRLAQMGYREDAPYVVASGEAAKAWIWEHPLPRTAGISEQEIADVNIFPQNTWPAADLAAAMRANRNLQVFQIHAYYDFATPFAWADYDLAHMTFDEALRDNIKTVYYESGHAPYLDDAVMSQMARDLETFYEQATAK